MARKSKPSSIPRRARQWRAPWRIVVALAALWATGEGRDLLRPATASPGETKSAETTTAGSTVVPPTAVVNSTDRLARTTLALTAVKQMQAAARALALSGANNLRPNLPAVPVNSFGVTNGLVVARGVPSDLANPLPNENTALWTGANLPTLSTQPTDGSTTVTIKQTQQQAVLSWDSFNIGKTTTLNFDQSLGGVDVGQWIAFNKIGVTGTPSQILGSIKADGQVYVINPNGIIFGGSAQVNTHALVASSLPINDNLVNRGLLNNPDAQFLFSGLAIAAGPNGTPAFTPTVSDVVSLSDAGDTYTLARTLGSGTSPAVSYVAEGSTAATLTATKDFTVGAPDASGKTTLTFTAAGLQKMAGAYVTVAYTPAGNQYGNVTVDPGAQLTAPTTADHVGGRVALIGANVLNAGSISTADGQTILAAGLQVGMTAHASSDPSSRGLDLYVGAVSDPSLPDSAPAGTVTNAGINSIDASLSAADISNTTTNPGQTTALGTISAPRGDVVLTGREVNQLGDIEATTSVAYNGRVDLLASYDAVSARGLANAPPFFLQNTGKVTLGAGSVTRILPELASTEVVVGSTLALHSGVNLRGQVVQFEAATATDPGATLTAPNATVAIDAGSWKFTLGGLDAATGFPQNSAQQQFIYDSGQIELGSGASLDVSGSQDVAASVAENIVSVQLRGPELANSPLQRNGLLRGQTVQVDVRESGTFNGTPWVGTPLADASGYVGLIQRRVGELTTDGGSVRMSAGDAVDLQAGSSVNVSGGWINYAGGLVQTTKLLSAGHIIDIAKATPDQIYDGIYEGTNTVTDPKWGTTHTTAQPISLGTYSPGYTQGGNGGALAITAPAMTLAGNLTGKTYAGARQRTPFIPYASGALTAVTAAGIDPRIWELGNQPQLSSLSLTFEKQYQVTSGIGSYLWYSPNAPEISLQSDSAPIPTSDRAMVISRDLVNPNLTDAGGFGNLRIDDSADNFQLDQEGHLFIPTDSGTGTATAKFGGITIEKDSAATDGFALRTAPGGSITLDAGNIVVNGGVAAPGGVLKFIAHNFWQDSTYNFDNNGAPAYDATRGNFTLAAGTDLSTTGLIADDRVFASGAGTTPLQTSGGSIVLGASSVTLESSSRVMANAGAQLSPSGKIAYGNAGAISLKAGTDPVRTAIVGGTLSLSLADQVALEPQLKPLQAYGNAQGGSLALASTLIQIGDSPAGVIQPASTLRLSSDFFSAGGFSSFSLQALGQPQLDADGNPLLDAAGHRLFYPALALTPGTQVHPRVQSWLLFSTGSQLQSEVFTPSSYLATPVSLTLTATGASDSTRQGFQALLARGDIVIGAGAAIISDPGVNSAVTISGQTVAMLGTISAPGGSISITGARDSTVLYGDSSEALPTVDLGPASSLSTAGATVLVPDANAFLAGDASYQRTGSVLSGGTIAVSGNVVAEAGSHLDVSGWSDAKDTGGLLNLLPAFSGAATPSGKKLGLTYVPTLVESNAGTITFTGRQELVVDGTLAGAAGGSTAAGGSLVVSSGTFFSQSVLDVNLQVTAKGTTAAAPFYAAGETAIGHAVLDESGAPIAGQGYFEADRFATGGFDALTLGGTVSFEGPVNLAAGRSLTVGSSGIIFADGAVNLTAPYIALGQSYLAPALAQQPIAPFVFGGAAANFSPTYGTGALLISAGSAANPGLIDVGNISLQGIGQVGLVAAGGDVRGYGTLDIAGNLAITAGMIYPPTASTFNLAAYDYHLPTDLADDPTHPGSVAIMASGSRPLPLSAGGILSVHASVINQNGVLRAPIGTINLGWNGTGTAPVDPLTGATYAVTQQLNLGPGSMTSVSASSNSSAPLSIPYGLDLNGTSWIDPTGADITADGLPAKVINLSGGNIAVANGAVVDTSGGGDLYAYQFVPGVGGTNDILSATSSSFAVIPSYLFAYAPNAKFNNQTTGTTPNFAAGDLGYTAVDAAGNSRLAVGDRVHLDLNDGNGPQDYTLLPARYALLAGAYLITPQSGSTLPPVQDIPRPDGSTLVAGYRFNAFHPTIPLYTAFEVAPATRLASDKSAKPTVIQSRAQYANYFANTFFSAGDSSPASGGLRLPFDAGQLSAVATAGLSILGTISAQPATSGRSGQVDLSSPENIVINTTGTGADPDTVYLSSSELSGFGAGSLLIGGTRTTSATGTTVTVQAGNLTVDNAGSALSGPDLILVANGSLNLAPGADVHAGGTLAGTAALLTIAGSTELSQAVGDTLTLTHGGTAINFPRGTPTGDSIVSSVSGTITQADGTTVALIANSATTLRAGSSVMLGGAGTLTAAFNSAGDPIPVALGDGALLRVSRDANAQIFRAGVAGSTTPTLQIGKGAMVAGDGVILDSSNLTVLDPATALSGTAIALDSGRIGLQLSASAESLIAPGLILTGATLESLQASAKSLSLLSYSSIDTYGSGQVGRLDAAGNPTLTNLALHAGAIQGDGGNVTFNASKIVLDNSAASATTAAPAGETGTLTFNADSATHNGTITIGTQLSSDAAHTLLNNQLGIGGYEATELRASGGLELRGSGGLNPGVATTGNLTITSPVIAGASGARQSIVAGEKLLIQSTLGTSLNAVVPGLGATLGFTADQITLAANAAITAPSGSITLEATHGDLAIGGKLDVSGSGKTFNDVIRYTDGGQVSLVADAGNVTLQQTGEVKVAAVTGGGAAGQIAIAAPTGQFIFDPRAVTDEAPALDARNGQGGEFKLDVLALSDAGGAATTSLTPIEELLTAGGFSRDQSIRVRAGSVEVDGAVKARAFDLSTDQGSITVDSTGSIDASGITGGTINLVAGGSVTLAEGAQLTVRGLNYNSAGRGGSVALEAGSFTAANPTPPVDGRGLDGRFAGTAVDIAAGSTLDLSVVNNQVMQLNAKGSSINLPLANIGVYFPAGTPGDDRVAIATSGTITSSAGVTTIFSGTPTNPFLAAISPGSTVVLAAPGAITFASGAGGSIAVGLPSLQSDGSPLTITGKNLLSLAAYRHDGELHLRAPQVADPSGLPVDVRIDPVAGAITGASSITIEGFKVFDLSQSDTPGLIDATVQHAVRDNGANFAGGVEYDSDGNVVFGNDGTPKLIAGHTTEILDSLFGLNAATRGVAHVRPGAEVVNANGDLVLNSPWDFSAGAIYNGENPADAASWDLSAMAYRFGRGLTESGYLRLRAQGNVVLGLDADSGTIGSLSDGFGGFDGFDISTLWQASLLPSGTQSWDFRLVAGSDFSAADSRRTVANAGSLLLGLGLPALPTRAIASSAQAIVPDNFQTIRTGTGNIGIYAGSDVKLLNNLATIYTAGTQAQALENFDVPISEYPAQYSQDGGDITVVAGGDIAHTLAGGASDSSRELPMNWLERRGWIDAQTGQFASPQGKAAVDSTSWWIDFSNFFEGVGALGGGNVTLIAGHDIANVDAVVPTNARVTRQTAPVDASGNVTVDSLAADQTMIQLGGGNLTVRAGHDIDGGVYYVEQGQGTLVAGNSIHSNATRATLSQTQIAQAPKVANNPASWLPTTLFLGNGSFDVTANQDLLLGAVANPFLLPQSYANGVFEKNYFSTFAASDSVSVSSLNGDVTVKDHPDSNGVGNGGTGSLTDWLNRVLLYGAPSDGTFAYTSQPWLRLVETNLAPFTTVTGLMPASLRATAFSGDVNISGSLTLSPSAEGQIELVAAGSINGVQPNAVNLATAMTQWGSAAINLSDADPARIPSAILPLALSTPAIGSQSSAWLSTAQAIFTNVNSLFAESGSTTGSYGVIQTKQALHAAGPLHAGDLDPVHLYASNGDISGLTLFAGKSAFVKAGRDVTDIAVYVQNNSSNDITAVSAGRDIITYNPNSTLRNAVSTRGDEFLAPPLTPVPATGSPTAGDVQIGGPGALEMLAGRNLSLGVGPGSSDGTSVGITSIGNTRNPGLPFEGADIIALAGLGESGQLAGSTANFTGFVSQYLDPESAGANATRYLPELAKFLGLVVATGATPADIWAQIRGSTDELSTAQQKERISRLGLDAFYLILRDAGRDRNNPESTDYRTYAAGYKAIQLLFPGSVTESGAISTAWSGDLNLATRLIETTNGGNIALAAPGGEITVGRATDPQKPDQGLLTAHGGDIDIFSSGSVDVGTSRIFTLRGGNEVIWSSIGNIAAGSGSKTVKAAPPTRVLIDPQSGNVKNDLAGLATGSGIGVLATLTGVSPGDVDLIAPVGTVDAGDAGIRSSGNLNIAALVVLNASNIQVGGASVGTPPPPPAPNLGSLNAAATASAGASSVASDVAKQNSASASTAILPSIITVEVLGYGGGDGDDDDDRKKENENAGASTP